MGAFSDFTMQSLDYLSTLFVFMIGLAVVIVIVLFIIDVTQTHDAVRRNYRVIGRFRYAFPQMAKGLP